MGITNCKYCKRVFRFKKAPGTKINNRKVCPDCMITVVNVRRVELTKKSKGVVFYGRTLMKHGFLKKKQFGG